MSANGAAPHPPQCDECLCHWRLDPTVAVERSKQFSEGRFELPQAVRRVSVDVVDLELQRVTQVLAGIGIDATQSCSLHVKRDSLTLIARAREV